MKYLRILIIISFLLSVFLNSLSMIDMLLLTIDTIAMVILTYQYGFFKHLGKYVVLLTFWISLMAMPAFRIVINIQGVDGQFGYSINDLDYVRILSFGAKVLFITCFTWVLVSFFNNGEKHNEIQYRPRLINKVTINALFVLMFTLSIFSLFIGLSKMGAAEIELPFHLAGIITLMRVVFFPILFAVILENYILCGKQLPNLYFVLFLSWSFLEVIVRLSKSALLYSSLPTAIVLLLYYRPKFSAIVKLSAPLLGVVLLLYPVIDVMRSSEGGSIMESFVEATNIANQNKTSSNPLLQPLNRTFMIPHVYAKDYNWISHDQLFDFSKAYSIIAKGGAPRYQTIVIDGYPEDAHHSSGTTGLEDPLLFGGYGFCYIIIFLLVVFAETIDVMAIKRLYSIYAVLIIMLWGFSNTANVSSLIGELGLQYLFVRLVSIYLAYKVNFSRKIAG